MRLLEVVVGLPPVGAGEAERRGDGVPLRHGLLGEAQDGRDLGGHLFFIFARRRRSAAAVRFFALRVAAAAARVLGGEEG